MISNPHHHDVSIVWLQACLSSVYFSARVVFFIDFFLGDFFSFVFLFLLFFVSLFVCLSARVHKSHKITRFHKIWWKSGARAKKILVMIQIMFYKKQSSGLGRRLVKIWYLWKYKERKITEVHVCIVCVCGDECVESRGMRILQSQSERNCDIWL